MKRKRPSKASDTGNPVLWGVAGLLLWGMMMQEKPKPKGGREAMIALIRAEAFRQGLPAPIALAFAEVESGFNPQAAGDLQWASKRPEKYRELVLNNPKLAQNPARSNPAAWHSYGLFQLLAPHHVRGAEHPQVLYDPTVNAQRGIAFIKGLMRTHAGELGPVRLAYAGASKADAAEQSRVLGRFTAAYTKWHDADAKGLA